MVILHAFLSSADFFQNQLFQEYHLSVKRFVVPDLGPNCLQRLSADDSSRQIVNIQRGGSWVVFTVRICVS